MHIKILKNKYSCIISFQNLFSCFLNYDNSVQIFWLGYFYYCFNIRLTVKMKLQWKWGSIQYWKCWTEIVVFQRIQTRQPTQYLMSSWTRLPWESSEWGTLCKFSTEFISMETAPELQLYHIVMLMLCSDISNEHYL